MLAAMPAALIMGIIGIIRDRPKTWAIVGTILTVGTFAVRVFAVLSVLL